MHKGKAYHELMLASFRDMKVRERFQRLVYRFTPYGGTILDFGAGTGIDAKTYAEKKYTVLVYEPCGGNSVYLAEHCRDELENGDITITNLGTNATVDVIVANFAVLNLIADHGTLFANFDRLLAPNGHVVVNLLNPFFLGDARYAWWRANIGALVQNGRYVVEGKDGPVHRMTPAAVSESARPRFRQIALFPRWPGLAANQYMFMVFRKNH